MPEPADKFCPAGTGSVDLFHSRKYPAKLIKQKQRENYQNMQYPEKYME